MPLPVRLVIVPPVTVMSEAMKLVEGSLRVKVSVATSPALSFNTLALTAIVGGVVSTGAVLIINVTSLLASEPSALALPEASVNTPLATLTTPLMTLLAVGMKKAV